MELTLGCMPIFETELGIRYVHTDATDEDSVLATVAEAESLGPLRIRSTPTEEAYWGPQVPFLERMGRSEEYAELARRHHRKRLPQRRSHPPRRRLALPAEVARCAASEPDCLRDSLAASPGSSGADATPTARRAGERFRWFYTDPAR